MPNDPWVNLETSFAAARSIIRAAQDAAVAEHRRRQGIEEVGATGPDDVVSRFPVLADRRAVGR